jgi:hypothetical protein
VGSCAVDRVLQLAFEDVDDLLTGMPVPKRLRVRARLDAVRDVYASGNGEVVLLQIGPRDSRRVLNCGSRRLSCGCVAVWLSGSLS